MTLEALIPLLAVAIACVAVIAWGCALEREREWMGAAQEWRRAAERWEQIARRGYRLAKEAEAQARDNLDLAIERGGRDPWPDFEGELSKNDPM